MKFFATKTMKTLSAVALLATVHTARAAETNYCDATHPALECITDIQPETIQPVRPVFKFQAQVSKAKLPLGAAELSKVEVRVLKGNEPVCTETLSQVQVKNGVVNLSVGASCPTLAAEMAKNTNLKMQVCIVGTAAFKQCLEAIDIGTVPYAVKAQYALIAQQANQARSAAEADYAHRITADGAFSFAQKPSGYFDFRTPDDDKYLGDVAYKHRSSPMTEVGEETRKGGFIQWAPTGTTEAHRVLNISAKDSSDIMRNLHELRIHSNSTQVLGDLDVEGTLSAYNYSLVGATTITAEEGNKLVCQAPAEFNGNVDFGSASAWGIVRFKSAVQVNGNLTLQSGSSLFANASIVDLKSASSLLLKDSSVTTSVLADASVTESKIASRAVSHNSLALDAVRSNLTRDGEVSNSDLANAAVTAAKIADSAIERAKIAYRAISGDKIADGAVASSHLVDGSIGTVDLADGAVTSEKIATGTITASDVNTASIQRRVAGKCALGATITSINEDGSVTCGSIPGSVVGSGQEGWNSGQTVLRACHKWWGGSCAANFKFVCPDGTDRVMIGAAPCWQNFEYSFGGNCNFYLCITK